MLRRYFGKISPLQIENLVGHNGELVIDEITDKVYIMDGVTPGGREIANTHVDLRGEYTDIIPGITSTFQLGNAAYTWSNLYVDNAYLTSLVNVGDINSGSLTTGNIATSSDVIVGGNVNADYANLTNALYATDINVVANAYIGDTLFLDSKSVKVDGVNRLTINGVPVSGTTPASATPPTDPVVGTLWYDEVSGRLYVYYDNTWVDSNPSNYPLGNLQVNDTTISSVNSLSNIIFSPNGGSTFITSNLHVENDSGIRVGTENDLSIRILPIDGSPYKRASFSTSYLGNANVAISITSNTESYMFFNPYTGRIGVNTPNPQSTFQVNGRIQGNYYWASAGQHQGYQFVGQDIPANTGLFHDTENSTTKLTLVHDGVEGLAVFANSLVRTSGNLHIGEDLTFPPSNAKITYADNVPSYSQFVIQNKSSDLNASTDIVATADNGTDFNTYIDMGINSSTYSAEGQGLMYPNDGYLLVVGNPDTLGGNLNISTITQNDIVFSTNGVDYTNEVARFTSSKEVILSGNVIPSTTDVYNLGNATNRWNSFYSGNVVADNFIYSNNFNIGDALRPATDTTLGLVKVDNVTIVADVDGVITAIGGGSGGVRVDNVNPPNPTVGTLWYDTVDGRTYIYYNGTWVDSNPTNIATAGTAPLTSTSNGIPGQIAYDSGFVYICVAENTWKRAPLSTW